MHQNSSFTLRDINGFTPLYSAVISGIAEITELLCRVSPKETLYMENNVGDTIPETAVQLDLYNRTHKDFPGSINRIREMEHSGPLNTPPPVKSLEGRQRNVAQLHTTLKQLLAEGRLTEGAALASQLSNFAFEENLRVVMALDKTGAQPKQETRPTKIDRTKTAQHVQAFTAAATDLNLKRDLCHILDVHKSVDGHLRKTKVDGDDEFMDLEYQQSLLFERYPHPAPGVDVS
jgi:hypothetical protein